MISGAIITIAGLYAIFYGLFRLHMVITRNEHRNDASKVIASGSRDPKAKLQTYEQQRLLERVMATAIVVVILLIYFFVP